MSNSMPIDAAPPGDPNVILVLQQFLQMAQTGDIKAVCALGVKDNGDVGSPKPSAQYLTRNEGIAILNGPLG
jgi:hypothetical protein